MVICAVDFGRYESSQTATLSSLTDAERWLEANIKGQQEGRTVSSRAFRRELLNVTRRQQVSAVLVDPYHQVVQEVTVPLCKEKDDSSPGIYSRYSFTPDITSPRLQRYANATHEVRLVSDDTIRQLVGVPTDGSVHSSIDIDRLTVEDGNGGRSTYLRIYLADYHTLNRLHMVMRGASFTGLPAQRRQYADPYAGRLLVTKVQDIWSDNGKDHLMAEVDLTADDVALVKSSLTFLLTDKIMQCLEKQKAKEQQMAREKTAATNIKHEYLNFDMSSCKKRCAGCSKEEGQDEKYMACQCRAVLYCSRECLAVHWAAQHKALCKGAKPTGAQPSSGSSRQHNAAAAAPVPDMAQGAQAS